MDKTIVAILLAIAAATLTAEAALANVSKVVATYYREDIVLIDDQNAEFEVISSSSGNPNLSNTAKIIKWSDGTITTIVQMGRETFMDGHQATPFGVGHIGGRIYEAYCIENVIEEMVCYKFIQ